MFLNTRSLATCILLLCGGISLMAQTPRPAVLVKHFGATTDLSHFCAINAPPVTRIFFIKKDGVLSPGELWFTDGAFTTKALTTTKVNVVAAMAGSKRVYYLTNDRRLFTTEGANAGVELPVTAVGTIDLGWAVETGGKLFFRVVGTERMELWTTDGTAANTRQVKVLMSSGDVDAEGRTPVGGAVALPNGKVYFANRNMAMGTELWVSNGTAAGTAALKDIVAGAGASDPNSLKAVGTRLFFNANNQPWTSDGTSFGTVQLTAVDMSSSTNQADHFVAQDNGFYFAAQRSDISAGWADRGLRFWNGTTYSTVLGQHRTPRDMVVVASDICLLTSAAATGTRTRIIRVVQPNSALHQLAEEEQTASRLMAAGRMLYYLVKSPTSTQHKLMALNPEVQPYPRQVVQPSTAPVTHPIVSKAGLASNMVIVGTTLYFAADYTGNGQALYKVL